MSKTKRVITKYASIAVALLLGVIFIVVSAGPSILRLYVEKGMGGSYGQPIFSAVPKEEVDNPAIDTAYIQQLIPYDYPDLEISLPRKFSVTKEIKTRPYYKRKQNKNKPAVIYLLVKKPGYFPGLFPRVKRAGITSNYEFVARVMSAKTKEIKSIQGAFFSIMKSIFTPDMGGQKNLAILKFRLGDKLGFITHDLSSAENYFDCNFTDSDDYFYKIYIKDKPASLGLNNVLAIISTAQKKENR